MKKPSRLFARLLILTGFVGLSLLSASSCKDMFCSWYVYDEDGILTGYQDESTCKDWAAKWSDVTCECI
jgi:hypothetical protein